MNEKNDRKPSMTKRMLMMLAGVFLLFGAIVLNQYLKISAMMEAFASNMAPSSTVTAIKVQAEPWQKQINTIGSIRAARGVHVSSEVPGIVKKIHFRSGEQVDQGDLLIELDAAEEKAQLSSLRASRKLAEITFDRDQQQFDIKAISQADLDASATEVERLQAEEARAAVAVKRKQLRAPFAGVTGVHRLSRGQYINPAEALVSLQDMNELYIDFTLPQRQLMLVSTGDVVTMSTDSGIETTGTVTAIDVSVSTETRNARIEAKLNNHTKGLLPGMFANVSLAVGDEQALLTLPQTAISYNAYGSTVFIVEPAAADSEDQRPTAKQVFVTTGDRRGDQISVLEGLEAGTQVVTSGQMKLKNGTPLAIDNSVQPTNDIAPTPQEQ